MLSYGEENYYTNRPEKLIVEGYIPKEEHTIRLAVYLGFETTAPEILQQAQAFSMFTPKRLIVLRDAQDLKKNFVLKKPCDVVELVYDAAIFAEGTALLILYHNALPAAIKKGTQTLESQVAFIESAPVRRDNELGEVMIQMAKGLDLELAPQAISTLIERVGYGLETFYSELQKLSIPVKGAGGLISRAMVQQMVSKPRKYDPYGPLNAVQRYRGGEVLQIALAMAEGEKRYPVPQVVTSLYGFFVSLMVAHYLLFNSQKNIWEVSNLKYESMA